MIPLELGELALVVVEAQVAMPVQGGRVASSLQPVLMALVELVVVVVATPVAGVVEVVV